jgi:hypothetical protein
MTGIRFGDSSANAPVDERTLGSWQLLAGRSLAGPDRGAWAARRADRCFTSHINNQPSFLRTIILLSFIRSIAACSRVQTMIPRTHVIQGDHKIPVSRFTREVCSLCITDPRQLEMYITTKAKLASILAENTLSRSYDSLPDIRIYLRVEGGLQSHITISYYI